MAKQVSEVLSHWYHLIEGLPHAPEEFYGSLEAAVNQRQLPDIKISRIDYREGGLFSAKREYFRVTRKEHIFDICAGPFGTGFFVSWWLGAARKSIWGLIPIIGPWLVRTFKPATYYSLDTALMFQESVHSAVLEVIDDVTQAKGLRLLTEPERKPIIGEVLRQRVK